MMNKKFFMYTLFTWSIITSFTLSAAKQDSLVSKYLQTESIAIQAIRDKNIKTERNTYYNGLIYVDIILSALEEEEKPTLAVQSLDQHLLKKIDFIRTQSSIANTPITPLGLHRALKMLQEPVKKDNFNATQKNRLSIINSYTQKASNFNMEATRKQAQECIKKIIGICTHGLGNTISLQNILSLAAAYNSASGVISGIKDFAKAPISSTFALGLNGISTLVSGLSLYSIYMNYGNAYSKEYLTKLFCSPECIQFLQNIEDAIDSVIHFDNNDLDLKQKLETISVFDLYATLADLTNNSKATIGILEKKNDTNEIKQGIVTAFSQTKNQTITVALNEQGSSFGKNFLVMKKNKSQTQETMYDVAANMVCAHAFNALLGDDDTMNNAKKTTMPFIDVYHLIIATKTYSTNRDFTFLEEIYIPLKTLSS